MCNNGRQWYLVLCLNSYSKWRDPNHVSDEYLNCIVTQADDGQWDEDFCNENDIHTLVKHKFICQKPKGNNDRWCNSLCISVVSLYYKLVFV